MAKQMNIIGKKFNRLTVISKVESEKGRTRWLCKCDCGKEIVCIGKYIVNGDRKSCGCLKREKLIKRNTKHGMSYKHPLYTLWKSIKGRLKDDKNRKSYRDKNIIMCDEWENNYAYFYNWAVNNGYSRGLTIDRIDNNSGYNPDNCRFITNRENCLNRRELISNNTSGFNGVSFNRNKGDWIAYVTVRGKRIHIGYYRSRVRACLARDFYIIENELQNEYNVQVAI